MRELFLHEIASVSGASGVHLAAIAVGAAANTLGRITGELMTGTPMSLAKSIDTYGWAMPLASAAATTTFRPDKPAQAHLTYAAAAGFFVGLGNHLDDDLAAPTRRRGASRRNE
ncbi:hypothetical protein [Bordetella muralis]|jgi:hypothetical protein|uniref:hypothetical protein n=1 Tax=Bordetella muralis TaxID=1649130 RepID=UPI0039EE36CF